MTEWKQEEHLKNADLNLNQYGDDSTPENQISTPWGMNEKYTWEWTLNSNIAYNKDIKTADLDPEYKYGWDAQVANSNEAWYIARRNDNIASALYNEWLRSKEDVIQFLGSQKNWNNSTEADRVNTIESVWKRIWDIDEQNNKDNTEIEVKEMEEEKKEEPKWQDVDVKTFLQGTATELFWKMITWADTSPYDHNSNEWKKAEARLKQYERINALSVPQIASALWGWSILSWSQAMRDLQIYNPEKYQQLQEYQQKQKIIDQINNISTWKSENDNLREKTGETINNYLDETVANAGWDDLARMDLDTALSQNQWLVNYAERMSYYQWQINQLDQTIWNLAEDCREQLQRATGENVAEYMIQNMVNNRSKKLYKQRDNLMNQYNYYKGVYEAQVEQEATKWERDYKERQLALQESKALWDQTMDMNNYKLKERQQVRNEHMDKYDYNLKERQQNWNEHMDVTNMDYKNRQLQYNYDKMDNDNLRKIYEGIESYSESGMTGKGLKNNNPWNIKDTTFGASIWTDGNGFAIFETPEDGFDALVEKIKYNQTNSKSKYYWKTIAEYFKLYAPDEDGNNSTAYANSVAKQLWVSVDTPISELDPTKFASVIAKHDSGYDYGTYGKFRGQKTDKKTSSKDEKKTYTNEELYTQLRGGKIKYSDFLKNWNGDEPQEEVDDWIAKTYYEKSPMMTLSSMKDTVSQLSNMLWDDIKSEMYTLEHLNNNSNISSEKVVKMVNDYVTETNQWLKDADKINLAEYLSLALDGRYTTEDELKKVLKAQWVQDYKKVSKEIMSIWNE